jgi:peptide deformylase
VANPTDPEIARLAGDMKDTLIDIGGSGIAAPQVFESLRLVVYRFSARLDADSEELTEPWVVLVNPVLTPVGDEMVSGWERCLSIPGLHGKVPRHKALRMSYQDLKGAEITIDASGALAALLQHDATIWTAFCIPCRCLIFQSWNSMPSRDTWPRTLPMALRSGRCYGIWSMPGQGANYGLKDKDDAGKRRPSLAETGQHIERGSRKILRRLGRDL